MQADSIDYTKGETPMTDYQSKYVVELRDKLESLNQEKNNLQSKCDELTREVTMLREENSRLKENLKSHPQ